MWIRCVFLCVICYGCSRSQAPSDIILQWFLAPTEKNSIFDNKHFSADSIIHTCLNPILISTNIFSTSIRLSKNHLSSLHYIGMRHCLFVCLCYEWFDCLAFGTLHCSQYTAQFNKKIDRHRTHTHRERERQSNTHFHTSIENVNVSIQIPRIQSMLTAHATYECPIYKSVEISLAWCFVRLISSPIIDNKYVEAIHPWRIVCKYGGFIIYQFGNFIRDFPWKNRPFKFIADIISLYEYSVSISLEYLPLH